MSLHRQIVLNESFKRLDSFIVKIHICSKLQNVFRHNVLLCNSRPLLGNRATPRNPCVTFNMVIVVFHDFGLIQKQLELRRRTN